MTKDTKERVAIEVTVDSTIERAWECLTQPEHIVGWNYASEDWCAPHASNDLREGGTFTYRMEARDGSFGFDFWGTYDEVSPFKRIAYTLGDGRKVSLDFQMAEGKVKVVEIFECESQNPVELQRSGWQAILNRYKDYVEEQSGK